MENTLLCAYRAVALGQQIQVDACLEAHPAAMAATLALLQHRHTPSVPARSHRFVSLSTRFDHCRTWMGPPAKPRRASGAGLWQLRARRKSNSGDGRCRWDISVSATWASRWPANSWMRAIAWSCSTSAKQQWNRCCCVRRAGPYRREIVAVSLPTLAALRAAVLRPDGLAAWSAINVLLN